MSSEVAPDSHEPSADDAFWAALFQQEPESPAKPPEVTAETWSPLSERIDGRFRWSDGGKEHVDPWRVAQQHFDDDLSVSLEVTGYNKGGLLVQWHDLQGFIPASQLIDFPQFHLEMERLHALKQWVGRVLNLKVIEINQDMNRLILSERAALVEADQRDDLLRRIEPGDRLSGEVTNLTNFGAFVDLGGVEGLIHISELSWSRVVHPTDIVKPGEKVRVLVLSVDEENGRIALSLKRLRQDPWQTVDKRFKPGQIVEGVISNVVSFGAFVMIEDELEGLIHISELAEGNFFHPRNVVRQGQRVRARVLHVDGDAKRLALSLRHITPDNDNHRLL